MSNNYGEVFSARLKELRQESSLTIEAFANEVGVSKSSVGYYENQNRLPDVATAARMSEVLGATTDYLVGRSNARRLSRSTMQSREETTAGSKITTNTSRAAIALSRSMRQWFSSEMFRLAA